MKSLIASVFHTSCIGFGLWIIVSYGVGLFAQNYTLDYIWVYLNVLPRFAMIMLGLFLIGIPSGCKHKWFRYSGMLICILFVVEISIDIAGYYAAIRFQEIQTWLPVPLSLLPLCFFLWLPWYLITWQPDTVIRPGRYRRMFLVVPCTLAIPLVFLLFHLLTFGSTTYLRSADAILVFGARVHADGKLSGVMNDRLQTAIDLYQRGYAGTLILSGGTGTSGYNEAIAMEKVAIRRGVSPDDIILDTEGIHTAASIQNTVTLAETHQFKSILAVSNDYHLARIKLLSRHYGLTVYTVPAKEAVYWRAKPYCVAREIPVFIYNSCFR